MRRQTVKMSGFDPCGQKRFFSSKNEAWKEAERQARESAGAVFKKPYRCKYCKGFHFTSVD